MIQEPMNNHTETVRFTNNTPCFFGSLTRSNLHPQLTNNLSPISL